MLLLRSSCRVSGVSDPYRATASQRDQCSNVPTSIVADAHELLPGLDQHRRSATGCVPISAASSPPQMIG
jgi:hypothetical protein